ncbi:7520_t:CDS:2 [Diversispora eburnea]|uniref:7520_t:CDS:1 n=1 Tax=Diversispora eburnea TaxID=1213867 RepID=A0A9N8V0E4_9GLOM|nr:7520_t:CDS:2 [Diversispora eburnea]
MLRFTSLPRHNKWSKVKYIKGPKDVERGNLFAKLSKEIQLAIKLGGGPDPESNVRLSVALSQAKKHSLPKDNVENAFKKALGQGKENNNVENLIYEGYGPGGIAFIIETLTDNKRRTVREINSLFTKAGGSISNVSWMFEKKDDIDKMMENAMELEDVKDIQELEEDNALEITCTPSSVNSISGELKNKFNYEVTSMNSGYIPSSTITVSNDDKELVDKLTKFIKSLNENDDVITFHNNAETFSTFSRNLTRFSIFNIHTKKWIYNNINNYCSPHNLVIK